jgi:putative transposase
MTVQARSLLCYWAMKELGMTAVAIGKHIGVSEPTVLRSAQRGQQLANQNGWNLL